MTLQFSLREHKIYAAYNPAFTFSKATGTILRQTSPNSSLGHGYFFVVLPRAWLQGKYIRWNWQGYASYSSTTFNVLIYDGAYDRTSDVDFPSGAAILTKGNGLLQTLDTNSGTFGAETKDVQVDVSGGSEDNCTLFFQLSDAWSAQNFWEQLDWVEINSGAGGAGNLYDEQFTDAITMERSGTTGDYGYISTGSVVTVSDGTKDLYAHAIISRPASAELYASFEVNPLRSSSAELYAHAIIQQPSEELYAHVIIRNIDTAELYASFTVNQWYGELYCHAIIRHEPSVELYAHTIIRHESSVELYAHTLIRQETSVELYAKFKLSTVQFSLREHKLYAAFTPIFTFSKSAASVLRMYTATNSLGDGFFFVVVDRTWLNDKYVRFRWTSDLPSTLTAYALIYDGAYDRSSNVDFPSGSAILSKGNGLLQTLASRGDPFGWQTVDVQASLDGGSEDNCTIFIKLHDNQGAVAAYLDLDWLEINASAGGADTLFREPFNGAVVMELTGTTGDYGYISDGFPPLAGTEALYAKVIVQQPSEELYGHTEIRQPASAELLVKFEVGQGSQELYAHVVIQDTEDLYGHAIIRQPASADLYASFEAQVALNLYAHAIIRNIDSAEVYAHFIVKNIIFAELYGHAEIQQPASVELYAHTIIKNTAAAEAYAHLITRNVSSLEVYAHAEIRHPDSTVLYAFFIVRQPASAEGYAHAIIRQPGSAELYGAAEIKNIGSAEVYSHAIIRQPASAEGYAHAIIRQPTFLELYGHTEIRHPDLNEIYAHTIIRNIGSAEGYAHAIIRQPASAELYASFEIQPFLSSSAELYGIVEIRNIDIAEVYAHFIVRNIDSAELYAHTIISQPSTELYAHTIIRQPASTELYAHIIIQQPATAELYGHAEIRQPASVELYGHTKIRHPGVPVELYGYGIIRNIDSAELYAHAVIKNIDFAEVYSRAKIRHPGIPVELYAHVIIRQPASEDVYAHTIIKNIDSADAYAHFIVRNLSFAELYASFSAQVSLNLLVKCVVRHPYRLWTNRRYLNGVVELDEENLGDALLEYVIEGVMNDIKSRLIREDLTGYISWTDITKTPKLIRRATTYATVATLYARDNNNPLRRIVLGIRPLAARVVHEREAQERAMDYWEEKFEKTLALFATSQSKKRMIVDTADEEPVFSMEELPFSTEDPYYIKS
ncbi:hypothetical protein LCGC14_0497470 [marine sediment metagenome]|uniref:Uncharacterized protein n=1 Tax=marine sediment metagenome TaxID=412755 RepID=A0A0F9SA26_9ZZZZ